MEMHVENITDDMHDEGCDWYSVVTGMQRYRVRRSETLGWEAFDVDDDMHVMRDIILALEVIAAAVEFRKGEQSGQTDAE